jgi:ABC-type transport system involved in cytochrome c biogenesis ATPase subunit
MTHPSLSLQVLGLSFGYPHCAVFDNFHANLSPGLTLVRGDESCGKTTLLRLLAGELVPQAGRLVLAGLDGQATPEAYRARVFWADPRSDALNDQTARGWFARLSQQHGAWDANALLAHITGFLLHPHLDKPLHALSAGSRRKVLMAAALASGAPLTLMDEPVAGLDKSSVAYLAKALAHHGTQPGRMVVVAHYEALAGVPWNQVVDLPGV